MGYQIAQNYVYEIVNGSATIWRCLSRAAKAVIPSEIEGYPVTAIAPYAFSAHMDEKALEMKLEGEKEMVRLALCGNQLEEVEIPNTVKRVGRYCFYNCKNLRRISFTDALVDWGSGAFTGCHHIQELEVRIYESEKTTLKDLLVELQEPMMVDYYREYDRNSYHARLVFPEYYEEGVENTPARLINLTIHGSGMRFRNCFTQRQFQFEEYDKCFRYADFQEKFEVVASIAEGRLRYPHALKEEYKKVYEDYLYEHRDAYGVLLLDRGDISGLLWFIELLTSIANTSAQQKEQEEACLSWLSQMIDYAARAHLQEAVSLLMDYHHRMKPSGKKKKRNFEL